MIKNKPHYGEVVGELLGKDIRFTDNMMKYLDELTREVNSLGSNTTMTGHNTNPLFLPRYRGTPYFSSVLTTLGVDPSSATFWDIVDDWGSHIDGTGFVADEFRDVVNITGSGWLTHMISHRLSASGSVTWRVTVDSDVYAFPALNIATATQNSVIGSLLYQDTTNHHSVFDFEMGTEITPGGRDIYDVNFSIVRPENYALRGLGVRFQENLRIEVASTSINGATYQDYAGALYLTE